MSVTLPPIPKESIGENHVWREWFLRLREVIALPSTTIFHNFIGGLQGGAYNDYMHQTYTEYTRTKSNQVLTWLSM